VAGGDYPLLVPIVSLAFAATIAAALFAIDQLAEYVPGPWFEVVGAAVLLLALIAVVLLLRTAWRRHREGMDRRGVLWVSAAVAAALLAVVVGFGLVENAQITSIIGGADVHLTRPILDALPRPPGSKLLDEQPGLADTESISQDFGTGNLSGVVPFYEAVLSKDGWIEDRASATTALVRFTRGDYVLSVAVDATSRGYTLTLDRVNPNLLQSPSPSPSPT
jgi:hypothetical protein